MKIRLNILLTFSWGENPLSGRKKGKKERINKRIKTFMAPLFASLLYFVSSGFRFHLFIYLGFHLLPKWYSFYPVERWFTEVEIYKGKKVRKNKKPSCLKTWIFSWSIVSMISYFLFLKLIFLLVFFFYKFPPD